MSIISERKESRVGGELDELRELVAQCVIRHDKADIVLSSGRKSDFYFDGRRTSLSARGAALLGEAFFERIKDEADVVGGMTMGADPIIGAVLAAAGKHGRDLLGFIARKEPKAHGTSRFVEGPELPEGSRVVLVDDVATTGGSFVKARDALVSQYGERHCSIVACWCVVDRGEGAKEALAEKGLELRSLFTKSDFGISK